jgi:hypothetical protein
MNFLICETFDLLALVSVVTLEFGIGYHDM